MGTHPIFESNFDCLTDKMGDVRLRCKYQQGQKPIPNMKSDTTLQELQNTIEAISGVPVASQSIRFGYPPKKLDLSDLSIKLNEIGIKSGETLIVEGKTLEQWPQLVPEGSNQAAPVKQAVPSVTIEPGIRRHDVPADNHCLFYSIYFCINEGHLDQSAARQLRQKIAFHILDNQQSYSEAVLGKSPLDYSAWIQSDASWGGSIELRIFSDLFQVQIHAIDIMTSRVDKYNENRFDQKIMLLYTGIHYDPLYWDSAVPGLPNQTIFQANWYVPEERSMELALALRA